MAKRPVATHDGQHPPRDPNWAQRTAIALDAVLAGHTYQEAADTAGFADRASCWKAVQRELDRLLVPNAERLRKLHSQRLNKLRTVYFPKALAGDGWSADRVLRFDEREAALYGLDLGADAAGAQSVERRYVGVVMEDV